MKNGRGAGTRSPAFSQEQKKGGVFRISAFLTPPTDKWLFLVQGRSASPGRAAAQINQSWNTRPFSSPTGTRPAGPSLTPKTCFSAWLAVSVAGCHSDVQLNFILCIPFMAVWVWLRPDDCLTSPSLQRKIKAPDMNVVFNAMNLKGETMLTSSYMSDFSFRTNWSQTLPIKKKKR